MPVFENSITDSSRRNPSGYLGLEPPGPTIDEVESSNSYEDEDEDSVFDDTVEKLPKLFPGFFDFKERFGLNRFTRKPNNISRRLNLSWMEQRR